MGCLPNSFSAPSPGELPFRKEELWARDTHSQQAGRRPTTRATDGSQLLSSSCVRVRAACDPNSGEGPDRPAGWRHPFRGEAPCRPTSSRPSKRSAPSPPASPPNVPPGQSRCPMRRSRRLRYGRRRMNASAKSPSRSAIPPFVLRPSAPCPLPTVQVQPLFATSPAIAPP
jgi:hypothetical protein